MSFTEQVPGLVVKYAPNVVVPQAAGAAVPGATAQELDLISGDEVGLGWYEADLPSAVSVETAEEYAQRLTADPAIEYAEPQLWMRPTAAVPDPDDPLWSQQWGFASYGDDTFVTPPTLDPLTAEVVGTNLLPALGAPRGDAPVVAVIDIPRLAGYAAKFDTYSQNLGGFVEQIDRGAIGAALGVSVGTVHADQSGVQNRTPENASVAGLTYEVDLPDTTVGRDVRVLAARGDVTQSSFAFETVDDDWSVTDQGFPLRTLLRVRLLDVAPVNSPAYLDTSAAVRSLAGARRRLHELSLTI